METSEARAVMALAEEVKEVGETAAADLARRADRSLESAVELARSVLD